MKLDPVYEVTYVGGVRVLRRLGANSETLEWEDVEKVRRIRPGEKTHFFGECRYGKRRALTRSLRDTTCTDCLLRRAQQIRGWRWAMPDNKEDVHYIRSALFSTPHYRKLCEIVVQPADDEQEAKERGWHLPGAEKTQERSSPASTETTPRS